MLHQKDVSEAIIDAIVCLESVRLSKNYTIAIDEAKNDDGLGKTIEMAFHCMDIESGQTYLKYNFTIFRDSVLFAPEEVKVDWMYCKTEHAMKWAQLHLRGGKYQTDDVHHTLKTLGLYGIKFSDRDSEMLYHLLVDALTGKEDVLPATIKVDSKGE